MPADSLVYLETNDLQAALQPIVDSKPFVEVAKSKPDLSALKGVQLAVAITGFETSEEKLTDEQSVGRIQPHFVAVAETHAWQFQTVRFAEQKLGSFVAEIYGSEPTLAKSERGGGHYLVWTAADGRKAFALVSRSLIYFANDETAIDKCLAVQRGESDSIAKAGKVAASAPDTLASGYVGPDGIAQIASLIGLKFASEAGEESEVQSAIAGIVPQLIRGAITDVSWTMTKTEQGIEDKYSISLMPEHVTVLKETLVPAPQNDSRKAIAFIPPDALTVTRYNLKRPQIAWRSLMLVAGKSVDGINGRILNVFSESLLEAYGISDPESFLGAVDSEIWTVKFDTESEQSVIVASFKNDADAAILKKSVADIDFTRAHESVPGAASWTSDDKETRFSLTGGPGHMVLILGETESVQKCTQANFSYLTKEGSLQYRNFYDSFAVNNDAIVVSYGKDSAEKMVEVLGEAKTENSSIMTNFKTETRFTNTGVERKTTSDFGLIGSIIAQLNDN